MVCNILYYSNGLAHKQLCFIKVLTLSSQPFQQKKRKFTFTLNTSSERLIVDKAFVNKTVESRNEWENFKNTFIELSITIQGE